MNKNNLTAIYIRVSTASQKIDLQKDNLYAYAERAGLKIVAEYMDVALSGRKEGRPQIKALMKAALKREFDCVLVWKFDRCPQCNPLTQISGGIQLSGDSLY